jgi:short-subunit dehydrogenase
VPRGLDLRSSTVLLTGATGGLGRAIAAELASRGAGLVITGRQAPALESLAAGLPSEARAVPADLSDPAGVEELIARAGDVDVLVANAGVEAAEPLADLSAEEVRATVEVNLTVPVLLTRALLPSLVARRRGHLVFMSSMAGKVATAGNGPLYTATKWGLRGLALGLRCDLQGTGVGVSTIFPGPVRDAGMFAETNVALPRGVGTSSPEEVARAVATAIATGKPEIEVAARAMRLSARIAAVAPVLAGDISRRAGAGEVRRQMIAARRPPG